MARSGTPRARYVRHRSFERLRRQRVLPAFLAARATDLDGTGAALGFTADDTENTLEITAHGLSVGDGPFVVTSTDTVPGGLDADLLYWVHEVVDANTIRIATHRRAENPTQITSAGAGTLELVKHDSEAAILEYLRQNPLEVVRDATDVDDL